MNSEIDVGEKRTNYWLTFRWQVEKVVFEMVVSENDVRKQKSCQRSKRLSMLGSYPGYSGDATT
jgi:hypothetical protein